MSRLNPPMLFEPSREEAPGVVGDLIVQGWRLAMVAGHEDDDGFRVVYVLLDDCKRAEVTVRVPRDDAWYGSIAAVSFPGGRFDREVRDMYGIPVRDHPQPYRLVRHDHWPVGYYPLRRDAVHNPQFTGDVPYPFVEVEGQGVYEIPVGPIHAGLIEPGHFRFTVLGESILQLRFRLWYMHRGVEKLFCSRDIADGVALSERISGDTAVGHALAYVMAVEDALGVRVSLRDRLVRAALLELERLYNHVSDLGAIVNDVGYGVAKAHCDALKEELLRHNARVTGHRLLRGGVYIGGATWLASPDLAVLASVAERVDEVADIALKHGIVANRVEQQAVLTHELARQYGVLGYVARASGVSCDARVSQPFVDVGEFEEVLESAGDVKCRFQVRRREIAVSVRMLEELVGRISAFDDAGELPGDPVEPSAAVAGEACRAGLGVVEGWRGTIVHRVELGTDGRPSRVKVVDPSFFNWPAIGEALVDTIVPDFPLCNKSFNLSYAGNDL